VFFQVEKNEETNLIIVQIQKRLFQNRKQAHICDPLDKPITNMGLAYGKTAAFNLQGFLTNEMIKKTARSF
jgi:hypothetical protein